MILADEEKDHLLLLGLGRSKIFQYNVNRSNWERISDNLKFELPAGTLVYAEVVQEFKVGDTSDLFQNYFQIGYFKTN